MTSKFVGSAYLTLSVFVILMLAQAGQKPLCINSQSIEKITMVDASVVYRCAIRKKVPYSVNFVKNQQILESKILPFESWLILNWKVKAPKVAVQLSKDPVVTQLQGRSILIWEQNLKSTQQLEVEIAKNYLKTLNQKFFANFYLFEYCQKTWPLTAWLILLLKFGQLITSYRLADCQHT